MIPTYSYMYSRYEMIYSGDVVTICCAFFMHLMQLVDTLWPQDNTFLDLVSFCTYSYANSHGQ